MMQGLTERRTIWSGVFDWCDKVANVPNSRIVRTLSCQVSCKVAANGQREVNADKWPKKLVMLLLPKQLVSTFGGAYLKNSPSVTVNFAANAGILDKLTKMMSAGYAGCVYLSNAPPYDNRVMILLYSPKQRSYFGFIPNDQQGFVIAIRRGIASYKQVGKEGPQLQGQQQNGGPSTSTAGNNGALVNNGAPTYKRKCEEKAGPPVVKRVKITKHTATIIDETFSCIVCQRPMRHPVFTNCCKSLVACKKCSAAWAAKSNTCLKCQTENPVYTELMGMHDAISALTDCSFLD